MNEVVVLEERPSKVRKQDLDSLTSAISSLSVTKDEAPTVPSFPKTSERKVFRYLGRQEEVLTKGSRGDLKKRIEQVKERRKNREPPKTELNLDQRTKNNQVSHPPQHFLTA